MLDDHGEGARDKTRLCPACRMSISVLATKCRFCGEIVGRPRDQARQLSMDDLGGETVVHYAPSSNVMDALEAFRAEEVASAKQREEVLPYEHSGRKDKQIHKSEAAKRPDGLPPLDARSQALASIALPKASMPPPLVMPQGPTLTRKLAYCGALAAALVILYFGGLKVWGLMRERDEKPQPSPLRYHNRVPELREQGAPVDEVLEEAFKARNNDQVDIAKNQQILEEARQDAIREVQKLLNGRRLTDSELSRACALASRLVKIDPHEDIAALSKEALEDSLAYRLKCISTKPNDKPPTAVCKVLAKEKGESTEVTVQPGDTLAGRFYVTAIGLEGVVVRDEKRNGRKVKFLVRGGFTTE